MALLEQPIRMSNQEAAYILRRLAYVPSRGNGKSMSQLHVTMALKKAIYALETLEKGENDEKRG